MPEYQLLRCEIALAGDMGNVVVRHRHNPLTFPELLIAQYLHGEDAVYDIHVVGTCEMSNDEMLARLKFLFREEYVQAVFPGNRPRLPTGDQSLPICTQPIFVAPPTRPDSPDPKLKPLVLKDLVARQVVMAEPDPVFAGGAETEPTAEEIAAHTQDEDDPEMDMVALGLSPVDQTGMPSVEDVPRVRTNIGGATTPQTTRKLDHLPDVEKRQRPMREVDRARARG